MPAKGDHDARRRDVSEAVWRVAAARGFSGLTMRAVATELDASTGLVTHYFPSKAALLRHALDLAVEYGAGRERHAAPGPGLPALRAALLDVLPLTEETATMSRVWVGSWDLTLAEPDLRERQAAHYEGWRSRLRGHVEDAQRLGELPAGDADDVTARVAAFAHGLVVHALLDPGRYPPERQVGLLDEALAGLAT